MKTHHSFENFQICPIHHLLHQLLYDLDGKDFVQVEGYMEGQQKLDQLSIQVIFLIARLYRH